VDLGQAKVSSMDLVLVLQRFFVVLLRVHEAVLLEGAITQPDRISLVTVVLLRRPDRLCEHQASQHQGKRRPDPAHFEPYWPRP